MVARHTRKRKGFFNRSELKAYLIAAVTLQIEVVERDRGEQGESAMKVFELSHAFEKKWLAPSFAEKRKLLELVFSNFRLDFVTLYYEINKLFDILAKRLVVPSDRSVGI